MTELLPCPFCGGEADFGGWQHNNFFVNCSSCLAATNHLVNHQCSKEEAAELWNRRQK